MCVKRIPLEGRSRVSKHAAFEIVSAMASFLLSEVYIVEKVLSSGHPDLDDLTVEATVCTTLTQAHCEAIRNMVSAAALDRNSLERKEDEMLLRDLVKAMRKRGVTPEKRYLTLKEIITSTSRALQAEKTYYTVKPCSIVPHREYTEETMCSEALQLLGATVSDDRPPGSSARDPSLNAGPPRKRARGHKH